MFGATETAAILDALDHMAGSLTLDHDDDLDDLFYLESAQAAITAATEEVQQFEPLAVLDSNELATVERAVRFEIDRWLDDGLDEDDCAELLALWVRLRQLLSVYVNIAKEVAE
jgi:hypothetical protein